MHSQESITESPYICRLTLELEREDSPQEATEESPDQGKWSEYVDDLYQRLPHLAEQEIYSEDFVYDLSTGLFGFQEGVEVEGEDDLEHDLSSDIHMASTETLQSTESAQSKTVENKPEDEQSPDTSGSPGHEFDGKLYMHAAISIRQFYSLALSILQYPKSLKNTCTHPIRLRCMHVLTK